MSTKETHTNKTILRVLLAGVAVLLLCVAAVGGVAAADEPKITYHANNGTEQTYTQPFTPDTLVELVWEKDMGFTVPKDNGFLGWAVGSAAATEYYTDHQPVSLSDTDGVALYAKWAPVQSISEDDLYYDDSYWIADSGYYRLSDDLETNITVNNFQGNILVVLDLNGKELEANDSKLSTVTIYGGAVVTIKDGTTDGEGKITGGNSGVYLHDGVTLSLQRGTICDNVENKADDGGGGVFVAPGCHFFMIGGSIEDNSANKGGGVYVEDGTFTMTGGSIEDNSATGDENGCGGGVYVSGSTFTMTGGRITENEAEKYGGGVYVSGSTFTMTCGNIAENTSSASGGGVYVSGSTFEMTGGSITENEAEYGGGGVYNDGTFTMSGTTASITGNEAERYGGGVYLYAGTFTMKGGSIKGVGISSGDSVADYGGGVYVYSGTFNMEGGKIWDCMADDDGGGVYVAGGMFKMTGTTACITGNFASGSGSDNGYGGGVYFDGSMFTMTCGSITKNKADTDGGGVYVAGGMFTMSGGSITENFATGISSDNGYGGGVYVTRDGTFEMTGGSITKNKAYNNGGGVYVNGGKFNVSGSPVISDNHYYDDLNNLWSTAKDRIILTGTLDSDADIRISQSFSGQFGVVDPSYTTATPDDASRFHYNDGTGGAILKKVDGIITLCWDDGTRYTVTYDSNGATGGDAPVDEKEYIYGASVHVQSPPEDMVCTDCHFASWNTRDDGKGQDYAPGDVFTIRETMTLYAKWVQNTVHAIVLLTDGHGTVSSDPSAAIVETTIQLTATPDAGYTFKEWTVEEGGVTIENNQFTMPDSVVKIRGEFTPNTYTVSFNANGGSGTMAPQPFTYDAAQNLYENAYTKTGYTFSGWHKDSAGTTVDYTNGQQVSNLTTTAGDTITLYAVWTVNKYTVSFDANGGTGTMADQPFTYDTAQNLCENTYTRTGYTFSGWAKSSTGTVEYADKASVSNLTDAAGAIVILYAVWTANTYTVSFNANGGEGTVMEDQSFTYDAAQNLRENAYTKTGYTFSGWHKGSAGTTVDYTNGQQVSNLTITAGDTIILYAVWTVNKYTVSFDANGGTGTMADQPFTYDAAQNLCENTYARTGYTFSGWAKSSTGAVEYADKASVSNLTDAAGAIVILYAVWTANTYTVSFDANGGTGGTSSVTAEYSASMPAITLPTKTGCTFAGYFDAPSGGTKYYNADGTSAKNWDKAADTTLCAQWAANTYTVKFDANGGTGTMADQSFTYGVAGNLRENTYTRTGYVFSGWDTNSAGTTVIYADKAPVSSLTAEAGGTVTLYAVWQVKETPIIPTGGGSRSSGTSAWLSETPTATPTPAPTVQPAAEPTPSGASPAPFLGILAGLGAAAAIFGLRRK